MKNKTILYFILLCVLIVVQSSYIYFLKSRQQPMKDDMLEFEIGKYSMLLNNRMYAETYIIPDMTFNDLDGNELLITDLCKDHSKLCLYLPPKSCSSCLKLDSNEIDKIYEKVGTENFIIFSKFTDKVLHFLFKRENEVTGIVGNLKGSLTPYDLNEKPYFFVLDVTGRIRFIFEITHFKDTLVQEYLITIYNLIKF